MRLADNELNTRMEITVLLTLLHLLHVIIIIGNFMEA